MSRAALVLALALTCHSADVKLIIDTDLGFDVDDVGAIAIAHALADQGHVDLLAVVCNTGRDSCIVGVDIVNTFYKRKVPIGSYKGKFGSYTDNGQDGHYVNDIRNKFPHTVNNRNDVSSALDIYRSALQNADDKSVTIASIGETTNLQDLLRNDTDLVKQKVKRIVYMDGSFNFACASGAYGPDDECYKSAQFVVNNMPSPDVEQIFQIHGDNHNGWWVGKNAKCGMDNNNPVRVAYQDMCNNAWQGVCDNYGRDSWDLNTVYVAVMGAPGGGQCAIGSGRPCAYSVSDDGKTENRDYNDHSKNMYDFSLVQDIGFVGGTIEDLLCQEPKNRQTANASETSFSAGASGACTDAADENIYNTKGKANFITDMTHCGKSCLGAKACVSSCMVKTEGYSTACADCFGDLGDCTEKNCLAQCINGNNPKCAACQQAKCAPAFATCSGLIAPNSTATATAV